MPSAGRWGEARRPDGDGWPLPAALRRLAAVVDRCRGQPRPERHRAGAHPGLRGLKPPAAPAAAQPKPVAFGQATPSCGSPDWAPAAPPGVRGHRLRDPEEGHRALPGDRSGGRGGQHGPRRAPHDLRPAPSTRSSASALGTRSWSRPRAATACMPSTGTSSCRRPPWRSSHPCRGSRAPRRTAPGLTLTACHPKYSSEQRSSSSCLLEEHPRPGGPPPAPSSGRGGLMLTPLSGGACPGPHGQALQALILVVAVVAVPLPGALPTVIPCRLMPFKTTRSTRPHHRTAPARPGANAGPHPRRRQLRQLRLQHRRQYLEPARGGVHVGRNDEPSPIGRVVRRGADLTGAGTPREGRGLSMA